MIWDDKIIRQTILLNGAGDSQYNPILSGLPIRLRIEFSENVFAVSGLVGSTSPPSTTVSFTQDSENSRVWTCEGIAGEAPFDTVDAVSYLRVVFTSAATGAKTYWDKRFYIASLPSDAIQVYSQSNGWTSVNYDTMPTVIPLCAQMCPIRVLSAYFDDFAIKHYCGALYSSIFDYGTAEGDLDRLSVKRDEDRRVCTLQYIYLEKHQVGQVENHDIKIKLKTETGQDKAGVEIRVKLQSLSCWGFEIKDPVTS